MAEILKIGGLLQTDVNNYIVSESNADKITSPWKEAVEEIKNAYLVHFNKAVHSIYIRGTVSRGKAIAGISDIDSFAVISKHLHKIDRTWIPETRKTLERKYTFSTGIEFNLFPVNNILDDDAFFNIRFVIKTQSACIYGDDLAQKIPPFRADLQTASHFHRNLGNAIEKTKKQVTDSSNQEKIMEWCRWIMKKIIRAGFVLVMDKEQAFTRDLYPSYECFSKYFPEHEHKMKTALYLAINPTHNPTEIIHFLDDFGVWIQEQLERKFANT